MKNDTLFVWLQLAVGLYSKLPKLLFERLGDIESIYGCDDYSFLGAKNEKYIRKLEQKETAVNEVGGKAEAEKVIAQAISGYIDSYCK